MDHARPLLPRSHESEPLTHHHHGRYEEGVSSEKVSPADGSRDKIKCLDGLRGVACFLVFNYHFLWPWTPLIMLGYGARPPRTLEPYDHWSQLPIICLLYRGRPMVAIFFAISGYVICRHILRSLHQRRIDSTYKLLGSAIFRRTFRLYIPAIISMFAVAMLAQTGAFKSETDIFKGHDSVYINGTIGTYYGNVNASALSGKDETINEHGTTSIYMGTMRNTLGFKKTLGLGPTVDAADIRNGTDILNGTVIWDGTDVWNDTLPLNSTACNQCLWVKLGGMWEEHPIIYPDMMSALQNFAVVVSEWANPFTFNGYFPRYDPHTYTMPMELRGSVILYTLLLGTAALKAGWRLAIAVSLAIYTLRMGRWEVAIFIGGMVLSEVDVLSSADPSELAEADRIFLPEGRKRGGRLATWPARLLRYALLVVALYLLSYPDAHAKYTPGFRLLASLAPKYYSWDDKWRFYHSIGALILLPCVLRSTNLRWLLETEPAQYLGRISFSFYLIHGPVLHSLGFFLMPRLFERVGRAPAFLVGWATLAVVSLALANVWYKRIDSWAIGVGKKVELFMTKSW
ncbi:Uu.00g144370.m01.CDS01 [Anthostomella pinea]|uniref:Uu.00g144370.m01.CDS01 n=1 Tax=Anthostomella pinea TaxID=933095 RepID=A0AAI8VQX8_9PEZI|nr:Uu.00g144370.m01.CDS01 [Anthostomella pinea]